MHTVKLNIHDSIYEKLMGLLDILPKDKISILEEEEYPALSFEEARRKVERAANNVDNEEGIPLDEAFDKALKS